MRANGRVGQAFLSLFYFLKPPRPRSGQFSRRAKRKGVGGGRNFCPLAEASGEAPSEANHAVNKLWWDILKIVRTHFAACGDEEATRKILKMRRSRTDDNFHPTGDLPKG